MKSWIGEYGKIAAMAIILAVLFAFVWNRTDHGYLGALSKAEPKSFLKATDNSDFLVQLKPRPDPVLTVSVSKLKYQRRYDLLYGKEISARAVDGWKRASGQRDKTDRSRWKSAGKGTKSRGVLDSAERCL